MSHTFNLQLDHPLPSDFATIYESLRDVRRFGHLHEHIQKVEVLDNSLPRFVNYRIFEEIYLLGFIKNRPVYDVKAYEVEKNKHIRYISPVKKNIELIIDFYFKADTNLVLVEEHIQIKAGYIIGKFFLNLVKKAHLGLFQNLRVELQKNLEEFS